MRKRAARCLEANQPVVPVAPHGLHTDKQSVNDLAQLRGVETEAPSTWSVQMRAISMAEPEGLVQTLTGAILGCGGWILSRGANDTGLVNLLFEFERQICIDIYSMLVATGIELSQSSHIRFTELCRCTRFNQAECVGQVACIDLEIQTFSGDHTHEDALARAA
jgi:hypothetical protein